MPRLGRDPNHLAHLKIFHARSKNISFHVGHHLVSLRQALGPVLHHLVHEADAERLVGCEERAQLQRQLGLPLAYRVQYRVLVVDDTFNGDKFHS